MSFTVIEFFIFQLPMSFVAMVVLYMKASGNIAVNPFLFSFTFAMWYIDAIINPLWTVFLAKSRKRRRSVGITGTVGTVGTIDADCSKETQDSKSSKY